MKFLGLGALTAAFAIPVLAQDPAALDALVKKSLGAAKSAAIAPNDAAALLATPAEPAQPAKLLFGLAAGPSAGPSRPIGGYTKGCLAGAMALPFDGPGWQVMRLSRSRNWGMPVLVNYIERLSGDLRQLDGWRGLMIGDMSQPRGGPMLTGHASHQIGLDVDLWYSEMPNRSLSWKERETAQPVTLAYPKDTHVIAAAWDAKYIRLLHRIVSYPEVERVFVHPSIKRKICEALPATDRAWLTKLRPWTGHNDHLHVRLSCPAGLAGCDAQKPVLAGDDGCGKELDAWMKRLSTRPKPLPPGYKPPPPKPPMALEQLPPDCRQVLLDGNPNLLSGGAPTLADIAVPFRKPRRGS